MDTANMKLNDWISEANRVIDAIEEHVRCPEKRDDVPNGFIEQFETITLGTRVAIAMMRQVRAQPWDPSCNVGTILTGMLPVLLALRGETRDFAFIVIEESKFHNVLDYINIIEQLD